MNVDVPTEVRVAHLKLEKVLVGQVFCEKPILVFPTRFLDQVLDRDRVELEALERFQHVSGKLKKGFVKL